MEDGSIRLWDPFTGKLVAGPLKGHRSSVRYAQFTHDGNWLVSADNTGTVRFWDFGRLRNLAGSLPIDQSQDEDGEDEEDEGSVALIMSSVIDGNHNYSDFPDMTGWLKGPSGGLLLWIPPNHQEHFRTTNALSPKVICPGATILDHKRFLAAAGESWTKCYKGSA